MSGKLNYELNVYDDEFVLLGTISGVEEGFYFECNPENNIISVEKLKKILSKIDKFKVLIK